MLYILVLVVSFVWMVLLLRKKQLSWHSIVALYSISVFSADMLEVTFNLLLGLYKFPTHLSANPIYENEIGVIFADTLILPFTFIIFVHYADKNKPWKKSLLFAAGLITMEWIFLKFGYLRYLHWNIALSAAFYVFAFRFYTYLTPRIVGYNPPIPYRIRLLCFSHTFIMWVGAVLSLPILKLYQFRPGVFNDIMADCRFTDLLLGDVLSIICVIIIPTVSDRIKPFIVSIIACVGVAAALYFYYKGWLIYHNWNHFLMILRYFVPLFLIMIYDRWEKYYKG